MQHKLGNILCIVPLYRISVMFSPRPLCYLITAIIRSLSFLFAFITWYPRPSEQRQEVDRTCFGNCDETVCNACYYSNGTTSFPPLDEDCPKLCPVDAKGEIFGRSCLRKWGKCVQKAYIKSYGEVSWPTEDVSLSRNVVLACRHYMFITGNFNLPTNIFNV